MIKTISTSGNDADETQNLNLHVIQGEGNIADVLTKVVKKSVRGKKENGNEVSLQAFIESAGLRVKVTKNIDARGRDNIMVTINLKAEDGDEDFREIGVNEAYEDDEYIRQELLNMSFPDDFGLYSKAISSIVKEKIRKREFDLKHEKIGWGTYKGKKIFKFLQLHTSSGNEESEYIGGLKIARKGDLADYIEGLKKLVVGKPKLLIAFITGVYGILLQLLELPDCNLIINFFGKNSVVGQRDNSGIGKSTAVKLALTLFGNAHELFKTYNATDNKIEAEMANHIVIPYVVDDKLVSSIGSSQKKTASDLVKFVFRFVSGQVKGRLNDDKYQSFEKIHSPTIITAESSITEKMIGVDVKGQFSRIIEIPCKRGELTESKEHCEELEEFIGKYAGVGAEAFIDYLLRENSMDSDLKERYSFWVKKLNAGTLGRTNIGSRVSDKVALIMLSAELLNQCFALDMDINSVQETLENSVLAVNESASFADGAYEHLCNFVRDNCQRFVEKCTECIESKEDSNNDESVITHIGHYKKAKGVWQVWLLSEGIQEIFNGFKGFTNVVTLIRVWRDSGLLLSGYEKENRFTQKRTFYKNGKQEHVYMIRMPEQTI